MQIQMRVVRGKPLGHAMRFAEGEFVFGRGPECHVRPNSEIISRQHCLLRVTENAVHIRDLGSTNGTLVNGTRILEELPLQDGDVLELGPLVLQLVLPRPVEAGLQTVADAPLLAGRDTLHGSPDRA
jgi:pSer/pThr/pTyr-binding forkhead associated (FHA) protein